MFANQDQSLLRTGLSSIGENPARIGYGREFTAVVLKDIKGELPLQSSIPEVNSHDIVFVKNGYGKHCQNDSWSITQPCMIYINLPGYFNRFIWDSIEEVCILSISECFLRENLDVDVFKQFQFLYANPLTNLSISSQKFAEIEQLYTQIKNEYNSFSPFKNKLIGNLLTLILFKIKEHFLQDKLQFTMPGRGSQIVFEFKILLEQHYRDLRSGKAENPFRIQDYANALNLNANYLASVISLKTGKSIGTWISEKIISEAKQYLANSSRPVKEITYLLGFSEIAHFSNYFKKNVSLSPMHYRKANQNWMNMQKTQMKNT